jgi:sugar (pentulose or hexulose) kinase
MPFLGGGANSPLWTQIIADATRRPLAPLPDASTVAARGCAAGAFEFLGLWGPISDNDHDFGEGGGRAKPPAGYFPRRGEGEGDVFAPDADAAATHDKNYAVWCKLHDALAGAGAGSLV